MMSNNDDVENGVPSRRELIREKSVTMEYFLQSTHLDAATAELLKKYDKDGNGSFSKDEVVTIILDLREAMQSNEILGASNKLFKRLLIGAVLFCVLLLTSMFGLSYAVAALTAKIDVQPDGLMRTIDGKTVVATDSSASMFHTEIDETNGLECVSRGTMSEMLGLAMEGRNVLLGSTNGTKSTTSQLTGSVIEQEGNGTVTCFGSGEQKTCFSQNENCLVEKRRRSLQTLDINSAQCITANTNQLWDLTYNNLASDSAWTSCMIAASCSFTDTSAWLTSLQCKCGCYLTLNGFSKGR